MKAYFAEEQKRHDPTFFLSSGGPQPNPEQPERAERLATQLLTPAELQRLAQLPEPQHAAQISLSFSLKESLFKALYPLVQQRFYFQDAELLSAAQGRAELQLLRDLGPEWPAGSRCQGQFVDLGTQVLSLVSIGA